MAGKTPSISQTYFRNNPDDKGSKFCTICGALVQGSGNTTNYNKHYNQKHVKSDNDPTQKKLKLDESKPAEEVETEKQSVVYDQEVRMVKKLAQPKIATAFADMKSFSSNKNFSTQR